MRRAPAAPLAGAASSVSARSCVLIQVVDLFLVSGSECQRRCARLRGGTTVGVGDRVAHTVALLQAERPVLRNRVVRGYPRSAKAPGPSRLEEMRPEVGSGGELGYAADYPPAVGYELDGDSAVASPLQQQ
jgi:hypothetical protein